MVYTVLLSTHEQYNCGATKYLFVSDIILELNATVGY